MITWTLLMFICILIIQDYSQVSSLNYAANMKASNQKGSDAKELTDGNKRTCKETLAPRNPFFEVDLEQTIIIKDVIVLAGDSSIDGGVKLSNFQVLVKREETYQFCGKYGRVIDGQYAKVKCNIIGRHVRIQLALTSDLAICELQVHADEGFANIKISAGKSAILHRIIEDHSNLLTDGKTNSKSCVADIDDVSIDLVFGHIVSYIVIHAPNNGALLKNMVVFLENPGGYSIPCGVIYEHRLSSNITLNCVGIAQTVRFKNNAFSICEVEIYEHQYQIVDYKSTLIEEWLHTTQNGDASTSKRAFNLAGKDVSTSCSSTAQSKSPWWKIDFRKNYFVTQISFDNYNTKTNILLLTSFEDPEEEGAFRQCSFIRDIQIGYYYASCYSAGQFVKVISDVRLTGSAKQKPLKLILCDLKIHGFKVKFTDNAALVQKTRQSTTFGDQHGFLGVNGVRPVSRYSCASTAWEDYPWFEVSMGVILNISHVIVTAASGNDAQSIYIEVSINEGLSYVECNRHFSDRFLDMETWIFPCEHMAEYVRVRKAVPGFLQINEIQVLGEGYVESPHIVSQGKTVIQKNAAMAKSNAVDGLMKTIAKEKPSTNGAIIVDLGKIMYVEYVNVFMAQDVIKRIKCSISSDNKIYSSCLDRTEPTIPEEVIRCTCTSYGRYVSVGAFQEYVIVREIKVYKASDMYNKFFKAFFNLLATTFKKFNHYIWNGFNLLIKYINEKRFPERLIITIFSGIGIFGILIAFTVCIARKKVSYQKKKEIKMKHGFFEKTYN